MKILAIGFCPPTGAIADNFTQISRDLSQRAEVSVLCPDNFDLKDGTFYKRYSINYSKQTPFSFLSGQTLQVLREIGRDDFDIAFFFTQHILNLPVALLLHKTSQVMWWHEPIKKGRTTFFKSLLYVPHDYVLTRKAKAIIIACEAMRANISSSLLSKIRIVSLPFLEQFQIEEDENEEAIAAESDLIFFGNIETYKGLDILAEALEHLYSEQYRVQLTIIGKGSMGDVCPKLVNLAIAHADQIKVVNSYQPYATIISAVKASKAVVLPYISSTGTNTLPIAYRYKKPVIATHTGCFQNNVVESKTGLLVPPNNSIELAKAIKNIIDDPKQTQHMGEEAYEYFTIHFKQSYITQQILEICQEIC